MGTAIGGLASGIDTGAIVDQLVTAASRPKIVLEAQAKALEGRKSAYATLSARLSALSDALTALDAPEELRAVTGRSADESTLGVSVAGDAVVGRFRVKVEQLASASMSVSSGFATRDADGAVATGTLGVTVGGVTTGVAIDATHSSLDDVAAAINDQVDGVTAYVMETGDAATPYRLVVAGEDTGLANAVTLDTSGLDGATGGVPAFTEVAAAADARVEIDGIVVTDDDNDIDGAVQGLTFHAYETSTDPVVISVARDDDAMVEKIQGVVDAWNAVMSQVRAQKSWNPDEAIRGAFVGESVPGAVTNRLQGLVSAAYGSGELDSLGALGLTTAKNGDLELDTDTLRAALADDFDDVVGVMTGESGAFAALAGAIEDMVDEDDGTVTARVDSLDEQIETMGKRIDDFEDRMDAYRTRLERQFTAMEVSMARLQSAQSALTALLPDTSEE
ncbi:MAG: flagellar filament capping protein FliD [Myxococcota bacterium]